jgi:hypothetical protein
MVVLLDIGLSGFSGTEAPQLPPRNGASPPSYPSVCLQSGDKRHIPARASQKFYFAKSAGMPFAQPYFYTTT